MDLDLDLGLDMVGLVRGISSTIVLNELKAFIITIQSLLSREKESVKLPNGIINNLHQFIKDPKMMKIVLLSRHSLIRTETSKPFPQEDDALGEIALALNAIDGRDETRYKVSEANKDRDLMSYIKLFREFESLGTIYALITPSKAVLYEAVIFYCQELLLYGNTDLDIQGIESQELVGGYSEEELNEHTEKREALKKVLFQQIADEIVHLEEQSIRSQIENDETISGEIKKELLELLEEYSGQAQFIKETYDSYHRAKAEMEATIERYHFAKESLKDFIADPTNPGQLILEAQKILQPLQNAEKCQTQANIASIGFEQIFIFMNDAARIKQELEEECCSVIVPTVVFLKNYRVDESIKHDLEIQLQAYISQFSKNEQPLDTLVESARELKSEVSKLINPEPKSQFRP
jgi:hypothetical protein